MIFQQKHQKEYTDKCNMFTVMYNTWYVLCLVRITQENAKFSDAIIWTQQVFYICKSWLIIYWQDDSFIDFRKPTIKTAHFLLDDKPKFDLLGESI